MKASELARKTLEHLRESKWIRGRLGHRHGRHSHCVAGAALCPHARVNDLDNSGHFDFFGSHAYGEMEQVFLQVAKEYYGQPKLRPHIAQVNDNLAKSKTEMEQILEKTIVKLEEKGT